MKEKVLFFLALLSMIGIGCSNKEKVPEAVFDLNNLDTTVAPGYSFYDYACGGWMAAHPLKPEHARFGAFDELRETNQEQVKGLIEEQAALQSEKGSVAYKIGTFYRMAMDSVKLNADQAAPILPYLQEINSIVKKEELAALTAKMFRDGNLPFFSAYVYSDDKNSSMNIFHLNQGGYSMGDRDYYLLDTPEIKEIRAKYVSMISSLFTLAGKEKDARKASEVILKMETDLAKAAYSREKLRKPEENYHKLKLEELQRLSPAFDWKVFFSTIGLSDLKDLNVAQTEPIAAVSQLIKKYSLDEIKLYLSWNVINNATSYLSDDILAVSFDFYGKTLSGKQEIRPRWKRSVDVVNGVMGESLGELYVAKHFPPAAKTKMLNLVEHLKVALGERIEQLTWMEKDTKAKAMEKLAAFRVKIGYPDKWRDYSGLAVEEDSYWENVVRSNNFEFDYMISKFNRPVDKDEWLMTPQTVNAYYNPTSNEICFPAAILQPPFFNLNADDAINYGAIGVVIGHEMTHGFDDQGRMFDKEGNLSSWWTESDEKNFNGRTKVLVDFFNNISVLDTVKANGEFTLGENIADQGGLQVSWHAFNSKLTAEERTKTIDGFTPAQRFFLSYATIWASNIRNEEILRLTKEDSHSLARWRVNGALPHVDAWYEAFNIQPTDPMYIPKENRVFIW